MVTVNLHPEGKGYLVYGDERIEEDTLLPRVTSITDILDKFGLRNYKMEQALEFVGDTLKENSSGADNVAVGTSALKENTTASNNTAIGAECMDGNTTGAQNTAVGKAALGNSSTASYHTAIGAYALDAFTTSVQCTALAW